MADNYEGFPVVVYDSDGKYITKAAITEHDHRGKSILISDRLDSVKLGGQISVLILFPNVPCEFYATAKAVIDHAREISLLSQRPRVDRISTRHKIDTPAVVRGAIVDAEYQAFVAPLQVLIDNISTSGALIKTKEPFLLESIVEIILNINGKDTFLYGEIVRETLNADNPWTYAIAFLQQGEIK